MNEAVAFSVFRRRWFCVVVLLLACFTFLISLTSVVWFCLFSSFSARLRAWSPLGFDDIRHLYVC